MATTLKKTGKSTLNTAKKVKKVKNEKLTAFQKKVKKDIQQGYKEVLLVEEGKAKAVDAWDLFKEL